MVRNEISLRVLNVGNAILDRRGLQKPELKRKVMHKVRQEKILQSIRKLTGRKKTHLLVPTTYHWHIPEPNMQKGDN